MSSPSADRFRATDGVVSQTVGEELIFFHAERGQYLSLDPVGARAYTLLLSHGRDAAVAQLLEEYVVDRATLDADLDTLVSKLLQAGLIEADQRG